MEPSSSSTFFTSQSHPLRVDFVASAEFPILNDLGMTFAPGKQQLGALSGNWRRDLAADLERLRGFYGVSVLVSVIEEHELDELGICDIQDRCELGGIERLTYEVVDGSVPRDPENFTDFVAEIVERLRSGKRVVVHCKGGLGRTGLTAACTIIAATGGKITPEVAMRMVRAARPDTIENRQQEEFLDVFGSVWRARGTSAAADKAHLDDPSAEEAGVYQAGTTLSFAYGGPEYRPESDPLSDEEQALLSKFQGCLLGGAVGDALGAAVEFDSLDRIRSRFGPDGLKDYAPAYNRLGAITDDTQMTLFTAEGLIRANSRFTERGICNPVRVVYYAYMRWLETQGVKPPDPELESFVYEQPSWLRDLPELKEQRAPGNTCLSALRSGRMGSVEEPINNSKGCGGVMRVAPVGLFAGDTFRLASDVAAITHGHPAGYHSAGVLAEIIKGIIEGNTPSQSINRAVYEILPMHKNHEETFRALDKAVKLAADRTTIPSPAVIETLGGGWVGEEALAIAIYCSLVHENDFGKAVLLAVNHSGDSDSTGSITGNILGAHLGYSAIPARWLERLELRGVIEQVATDLFRSLAGFNLWEKYPGC